jgi:uncharacterized Zn finger protein
MTGPRYWGYYDYAPLKEVKDGIKAKSRRGAIGEKWWSKRFVSLLESFNIGARLSRGRSYARKGQVISIDVQKGVVRSKVQGTRSKPYDIKIMLSPLSDDDWNKAIDAMASKAVFAAKLLSGEMPSDIEDAFADAGVALFPKRQEDLETDCSCPDWSNPCKHIAAVYYLLAEQFDQDPFLIFKLRGRTKEEIVEALRERRSSCAADEGASATFSQSVLSKDEVRPLEECLESFWKAGGQLDSLELNPTRPEVENAVLKRLGDSPFFIGKTNLSSLLSKAYGIAGKAALRKATGEMGEP